MARQVKVEILGDARGLRRAFGEAERATSGFGKTIARAGVFAATGLAGVAAGVGVFAVKSIQAAQESNKVAKQTATVIKSTGGAAKVTAQQISDLATAISNKTGIDDEAIQSGANLLLTFTRVRNEAGKGNDVFNQATSILADMSVALGQDTTKGAIQLGKALNDPIRGVTALQRVGVSFTASQREQIKTLVESGKTMEAQKLILAELGKEFGGSAAAAATPLDRLKVVVGNLQEAIGNALLPTVNRVATFFATQIPAALATASRWWHDNEGIVRTLAGVLASLFTPATHDATTATNDFAKSGRTLKGTFDAVLEASLRLTQGFIAVARLAGNVSKLFIDLVGGAGHLINAIDRLSGGSGRAGNAMIDWARKMREDTLVQLGRLADEARTTQAAIDRMHGKTITITTVVRQLLETAPARVRQHGGPVTAQQAYVVGEGGPELFVSSTSGRIIPNYRLPRGALAAAAGGGAPRGGTVNYTVNVYPPVAADQAAIGGQVVQAIKAYERGNGRRWRTP